MGVFAVILSILAVLCAVLAPFLFGTTGAIIAAAVAVVAVILAFLKRRKDGKGGIVAMVIAVLAVVIGFSMTSMVSDMFKTLHTKAVELMPDGLWASVSEDTEHGFMGLLKNMPTDEATLNKLVDEMNELNKMTETK